MFNRRQIMSLFGLAGVAGAAKAGATESRSVGQRAGELAEAIEAMPVLDVHSHGFPALAPVTEEIFLETLSLGAWMLDAYFPAEAGDEQTVYEKWRAAGSAERQRLDRKYGIQKHFDAVVQQMRSTTFVEALIKEMALFFRCRPTLREVIAARNEYTRGGYWKYVNDLFDAVRLEGALVQGGLGAWTMPEPEPEEFKRGLEMKVHDVASPARYKPPKEGARSLAPAPTSIAAPALAPPMSRARREILPRGRWCSGGWLTTRSDRRRRRIRAACRTCAWWTSM